VHAADRGDAHVIGALVAVVAIWCIAPGARAAAALVVFGASIAVIARLSVGGKDAPCYCVTCVVGAWVAVLARQFTGRDARPQVAMVVQRAHVAVVTGGGIENVLAAGHGVT